LVRNDLYVEELLCNDAAKTVIDQEFKNDLKSRLMFGDEYKDITKPTKHKNSFKQNRYFKIASGFVICVFVSGTILKAVDIQSKNIVTKSEGTPDVIVSMTGQKDSNITGNKKQDLLQSKEVVVDKSNKINQLILPEIKKTITTNSLATKNNVGINEDTNDFNVADNDDEINQNLVNPGKSGSVSTDVKGPIEVPKMDGIKEETVETLKSYDSRYSFDEKRLVSVKSGGIYVQDIATSKEKKLVAYNEKTHIVDKPNLTPDDGIIYYKAEKVTLDNGTSEERNGAIYLTDSSGQGSTKIVDGKNPMVSKDGKKVVYEAEGKIYILTLASKDKMLIDNGSYPAFAANGNLISYVKEEKETQNYDASNKKSYASTEKIFSSLWMFDLTTESARMLTNKETNVNNNSIQSWAQAVRNGNVENNVNVKYSYYESIWSTNNKEIYAIRKNNDAQVFELIKFNLDD
jgi:hypothetical protein